MSTYPVPLVLANDPVTAPTQVELQDDVVVVQMHHERVTMEELTGIFDRGFGVLSGFHPVGPGFACYRGDVSATFDLTLGFPVGAQEAGRPAELPDGVEYGKFPAGPAWVVSHVGPYDGLPAAWAAFLEKVGSEGGAPAGGVTQYIEIYVDDPTQTDAAAVRTDLVLPSS